MGTGKFYMLYAEGKTSPTFKHHLKADAIKEAERLSLSLNVPIYVLEATEKVEQIRVSITKLEPSDDLPF